MSNDRGENDRATDHRPRPGILTQSEPHPDRREDNLEHRDQTGVGGRNEADPGSEEQEAEPHLADPKHS